MVSGSHIQALVLMKDRKVKVSNEVFKMGVSLVTTADVSFFVS
jgi:hypothetical protein